MESNEGKHFWMELDELKSLEQKNGFHKYIDVFIDDGINEAYGSWNDDEPWEIIYK